MSEPSGVGSAQIFERGYRRYDDVRLGRVASMRTVWAFSLQRMLGIRRSVWAKVLPVLIVFTSYVPAIVFVGVAALTRNDANVERILPAYSDYYLNVVLSVMLFAAFIAPDVLCPDRRTGMLGLYLASPLTRDTYLLAKAAAIFTGLLLVTTGPQLLMLTANSLQGQGVGSAGDTLLMYLRVTAAGIVVSSVLTAIVTMISAFTDRRGFASAAIILVFLASEAIAGTLSESHPNLVLIGLPVRLPDAITTRVFGVRSNGISNGVPTIEVWLVAAAICVVGLVATHLRYRTLQVTR